MPSSGITISRASLPRMRSLPSSIEGPPLRGRRLPAGAGGLEWAWRGRRPGWLLPWADRRWTGFLGRGVGRRAALGPTCGADEDHDEPDQQQDGHGGGAQRQPAVPVQAVLAVGEQRVEFGEDDRLELLAGGLDGGPGAGEAAGVQCPVAVAAEYAARARPRVGLVSGVSTVAPRLVLSELSKPRAARSPVVGGGEGGDRTAASSARSGRVGGREKARPGGEGRRAGRGDRPRAGFRPSRLEEKFRPGSRTSPRTPGLSLVQGQQQVGAPRLASRGLRAAFRLRQRPFGPRPATVPASAGLDGGALAGAVAAASTARWRVGGERRPATAAPGLPMRRCRARAADIRPRRSETTVPVVPVDSRSDEKQGSGRAGPPRAAVAARGLARRVSAVPRAGRSWHLLRRLGTVAAGWGRTGSARGRVHAPDGIIGRGCFA